MTTLFDAVLLYLTNEYHAGNSFFSVEPCDNGQFSSFFETKVCKESKATAEARYRRKVTAAFKVAEEVLCLNPQNEKLEGCTPYVKKHEWYFNQFISLTFAISGMESGLREDVDNGRGYARECTDTRKTECGPDDVGGRGRGPAREACGMQVHPDSVGRFSDYNLEELLGTTEEAYEKCFRVGMRMLVRSRAYCAWYSRTQVPKDLQRFKYDWVEQTVSMYGTGTTCYDYGSKTMVRTRAFSKMYTTVRAELRKRK